MRTARIIETILYFHFALHAMSAESCRYFKMTHDRGLFPMENKKQAMTREAKRY